jgi:transcriptional regulator with XRE-family HTH domain
MAGYTDTSLSAETGINVSTINNWKLIHSSSIRSPNERILVARALRVNVEWLINGIGYPNNSKVKDILDLFEIEIKKSERTIKNEIKEEMLKITQ